MPFYVPRKNLYRFDMIRAAVVLILFGAASAATTGVVFCTNCTVPVDIRICHNISYNEAGPTNAEIQASCGGDIVGYGCATGDEGNLMRVLALANRTAVFAEPGAVISGNGSSVQFFDDSSLQVVGARNSSSGGVPVGCNELTNDAASLCRRRSTSSGDIIFGGRCGLFSFSGPAMRFYVFATPCAGKVASDPCVSSDGACATGATCTATDGVCGGGTLTNCTGAANQCENDAGCNLATGACETTNKTVGTPCQNENQCIIDDTCDGGGTCRNGTLLLVCPIGPQCSAAGVCQPSNGTCTFGLAPNGTACTDGDACTNNDRCSAGSCAGVPIVFPDYDCRFNATCVAGLPIYVDAANGVVCGDEFGACFINGTCTGGTCIGTVPAPPPDIPCYNASDCQGGAFNLTKLPSGTACNPDDGCAISAECDAAGTCQITDFEVCPAPNQCFLAGVCNSTGDTSFECVNNFRQGAECTISLCELGICNLGGCDPTTSVSCPGDDCNFPTTCSNTTGCLNPRPDGTSCEDPDVCGTGICQSGVCNVTQPCPGSRARFDVDLFIDWVMEAV